MIWYQKYIENPIYHQQYKSSFQSASHWFGDPEDAFSAALEQLFYVKLPKRQTQPPNNPDGFVMTAFQNVLIDLSRAENGRLRAPREIQRRGPLHEAVFFQVREGFKPISVIIEESPLPAESVIETVSWIKAHSWMPMRPQRSELENGVTGELKQEIEQQANASVDPVLENAEAEQLLAMLQQVLQPINDEQQTTGSTTTNGEDARHKVNRMREELALDTLDRALLNEFKHGSPTVAEISQMLGVSRTEVRRRKQQLIPRIEAVFARHGFLSPQGTRSIEPDSLARATQPVRS